MYGGKVSMRRKTTPTKAAAITKGIWKGKSIASKIKIKTPLAGGF